MAPDPHPAEPVDVTVLTSGHDVADARLHRLCAAFLERGLVVEVLGRGDAAGAPPGTSVRTTPSSGLVRRALTAVRFALAARGRVVVALDPDSLLAARVGGVLRRRAVVADVHEDYAALLADRPWATGVAGAVARLVARASTRLATGTALTLVADEHVPPTRARHRVVVPNLPRTDMLPARSEPGPEPRAVYVGDVRGARGLWSMLDAVAAAPGWSLDVVGPVAAADREELERRLGSPELVGRVRLLGRRPPREAWAVATGAWCGLALLEDTRAYRDALPSKLYEYLACGLPVLVTDLPRQAAFVREVGGGAIVPPSGAGAAAGAVLAAWGRDGGAELRPLREAAARWGDEAAGRDPYAAVAEQVARLAGRH